jgi:hypothetical protein
MLINGVLNLAIGLTMTFAAISLVVSALTEAVASALAWRSQTLLGGVKRLLNDPQLSGLALAVLNHAAANPLAPGNATAPATANKPQNPFASLPSYISSDGFAVALIDTIQHRGDPGGLVTDLDAALAAIDDSQIRTVLQGLRQRAGASLEDFHQGVADWFDTAMDRLSGDYKRRTQRWNFCLGLALVALLNVDAIVLAERLYVDPAIVGHAATLDPAKDYLTNFKAWSSSFPYGWQALSADPIRAEWLAGEWGALAGHVALLVVVAVPGWLLTAFATLFGAPFWFDTLQRFVQLRGTGPEPKPAE